jgi:hypothetical protein
MTHQGVRQLLIKLHAQGHVSFADPENPFWIVMRAGDKTALLSRQACGTRAGARGATGPRTPAAAQARRSVRWLDRNPGLSDHRRRNEASSIRSIRESRAGAPPARRIPAHSHGAVGYF